MGIVARLSSDPCKQHWVAVKRIFRYLRGSTNLGLLFVAGKNKPDYAETCVGFSDADWAGDISDRKSTTGYVFLNAKGAVQWGSKKQTCVALSTAEAEYIALAQATQEATWLNSLMAQMQMYQQWLYMKTTKVQFVLLMVRDPRGLNTLI